ncbi:2'-5' RNA ligase family protein [Nocardioides ungokensis]|uniref:2'-5' RNA ligase family protein n=1 Tax=Nocardioides ungokensis TaxID=1643322 RepID=UPI0015DDF533|nr:2'-5' RNA ligase family protein [Nocardioides ungokensis]
MALAVCLLFDPASDRLVRALWSRLEEHGVRTLETHTHRHHHPHLSYAVLRSWELDRVTEALAGLGEGGSFTLACQGMVTFPRGRAALAAAVTAEVTRRQERVTAALAATGADLHHHYLPGRWVPHVSLATRAHGADLATVSTTVSDALPVDLTVDRAALIDTGTGRVWPLPCLP